MATVPARRASAPASTASSKPGSPGAGKRSDRRATEARRHPGRRSRAPSACRRRAPRRSTSKLSASNPWRSRIARASGSTSSRIIASAPGAGSEAAYGARWTPSSVTIAVIRSAGVTSNAGLRAGKRSVTSAPSRSSIGIAAPRRRTRVDRRGRGDDHERDAVMTREHRETVRADLVRRVAVRGDPVGAGDHDVDLTGSHPRGRGPVDDDGVRDLEHLELERGQTRALKQRPCLVDPDLIDSSPLRCGADRSDRRAVPSGREAAGVAVGQDPGSRRHESGRVGAHRSATLDLVGVNPAGRAPASGRDASRRAPSGG